MKEHKAEVIFPDGVRLGADTWADLEKQLRADVWNPSDAMKFRVEMGNRARNWSGFEVDIELVAKQFIEQLEKAGLLLIVRKGEWT